MAFLVVLLCFLGSGFAALLYETVWTRQFALVFGTSELAVATVLAAYMGGLAAGAAAARRWAAAVRRPLLVYGLLELGIGISALGVPLAIRGAMALAVALFGGRSVPADASGLVLASFYLLSAAVILLLPTAMMGATLSLLARFAVRRDRDVGPRVGILYAVNTGGAVLGTVLGAFVLLPHLGLRKTVWTGAAVNFLVFAVATAVALAGARPRAAPVPPAPPRRRKSSPGEGAVQRRGLLLPVMLVSGAASFTYEVLWTRLLGHVLGGSLYSFATMLATFLTGLALGSALAARFATTSERAARGFGIAQVGVAALSWLAFVALDDLPAFAVRIGAGAASGTAPNALLAAVVLLPAAVALGATFPFAVRVLARGDEDAAPATAGVYAWNTAGAILGAIGTGFFLLPRLGYAGTISAAIATNLVLAAAVAVLVCASRPVMAGACVGLLLLGLRPPATPWKLVGAAPLALRRRPTSPIFFAVGRSATVAVTAEGGVWKVRINGLPEGTVVPRGQNEPSLLARWLGALPSLARPQTQSMLVVGLGAGGGLEAVPRTVKSIDVVELEPEVIAANRLLARRRAVDPLADGRIRLRTNDARNALLLTSARYDAVVSQPSHPWTAGAAQLFTREFFRLVHDHLAPGGVFVQWIELTYVDEPLLRSLMATLLDVFGAVRMYRPVFRSGVLFLASDRPLPVESAAAQALTASPEELAWAGVQTPEDVAAALALDEEGVRRFAEGAALTTDDLNLLETRSPRVLDASLEPSADALLAPLDPLPALAEHLNRLYLVRRLIADRDPARAERLAGAMNGTEKVVANALVALASGRRSEGAAMLREALQVDPQSEEARAALLRVTRDAVVAGDGEGLAEADSLVDPAAAVIEGWRLEARRDPIGVRALEDRLAQTAPHHPLYPDALELRAWWRIESGDAAAATKAIALLDRMRPLGAGREEQALRRQAVRVAGILPARGP